MEALTAENLRKTYKRKGGEIRALDGVGFTVPEHGIYGLLGMNGAGKSTAIKVCTGLVVPDEGRVTVFGHDVSSAQAKLLVGCSPQDTAVAPMLSVRENLIFISRIYGDDKRAAEQKTEEIMARLALSDRASDRAGGLSGGLMRRLSIGMALINSPKLIFLDEPTLGLDVLGRRELWKYIRSLAESSAIVLTTHYLEEAQALCSRIAIIAHGKITAEGTPAELTERSGATNFEDAFVALSGEEGL